jgi:tetratricopeptide (TPR) repeat protein
MGAVYAAYDPELDRKVALKLLRRDGDPRVPIERRQSRLLREAQAMAKLSHPNVVAVHDVGLLEDRVFVAMAFVEGRMVRTVLARARASRSAGRYATGIERATAAVSAAQRIGYRPLEAEALYLLGTLQAPGEPRAAEASFHGAAAAADRSRDDELAAKAKVRLVHNLGWSQTRTEEALLWAEHARAAIERMGGDPGLESSLLLYQGSTYARAKQPARALPFHRRALALLEKQLPPTHPKVAAALNLIGIDLADLSRHEEAPPYFQRSLAIREQVYGAQHPITLSVLGNVGLLLGHFGRFDESLAIQRRALALRERAFGAEHLEVSQSLHNVALVLADMGRYGEALAHAHRAAAIKEKHLGSEHPGLILTITLLAEAAADLGRSRDALRHARRAVRIARGRSGDHSLMRYALFTLARAHEASARDEEAASAYVRVLQRLEAQGASERKEAAKALDRYGSVLLRLGRVREAVSHHSRALAIRERTYGSAGLFVAPSLLGLGEAWLVGNELARAREALERAVRIWERGLPDSNDLSRARFALARVLRREGDRDRARRLAAQALEASHRAPHPDRALGARITAWLVK